MLIPLVSSHVSPGNVIKSLVPCVTRGKGVSERMEEEASGRKRTERKDSCVQDERRLVEVNLSCRIHVSIQEGL